MNNIQDANDKKQHEKDYDNILVIITSFYKIQVSSDKYS